MEKRAVFTKLLVPLVGVYFIVSGYLERSDNLRIKSYGVTAIADASGYVKNKHSRTALFTFNTDSGQLVIGQKSLPKGVSYEDIHYRRPIKVFYNPGNPREFVLEKQGAPWISILAGVCVFGFALIFMPLSTEKK